MFSAVRAASKTDKVLSFANQFNRSKAAKTAEKAAAASQIKEVSNCSPPLVLELALHIGESTVRNKSRLWPAAASQVKEVSNCSPRLVLEFALHLGESTVCTKSCS